MEENEKIDIVFDQDKFEKIKEFYDAIKLLGFELKDKNLYNSKNVYGLTLFNTNTRDLTDKYTKFMDEKSFKSAEVTTTKDSFGTEITLSDREGLFGNYKNMDKYYCNISIFSNNIIKIVVAKFEFE